MQPFRPEKTCRWACSGCGNHRIPPRTLHRGSVLAPARLGVNPDGKISEYSTTQGWSKKTDMKHNEPSIVPMAHTKKYVLALLLACAAARSQCHGFFRPAVAPLVIDDIELPVDVVVKTSSFLGSEVATVSAQLHSYSLERIIEYSSTERHTHRWLVFEDLKGNYNYSYKMFKNGAVVPDSNSTSLFPLGGKNGLPLTKRDYYCKNVSMNYPTIISEKSGLELMVYHKVTKRGGYFYRPPDSVNVNFTFDVNKLPGTCGGKTLPGLFKTSSCSVYRNGWGFWSYPHVNCEVVKGTMSIP